MSDTFNHEADAWDSLDWDYDEDEGQDGPGNRPWWPRCKTCGAGPLQWRATGYGWRLYDGDKRHVCDLTDARRAAFAALPKQSLDAIL